MLMPQISFASFYDTHSFLYIQYLYNLNRLFIIIKYILNKIISMFTVKMR